MEMQLKQIKRCDPIEVRPARRCGAIATPEGVRWRVWAPKADRLDLVLMTDAGERRVIPMTKDPEAGFHAHREAHVRDGQRYVYRLDGGDDRPDPCSLWQPDGVAGPSAVVDPSRFRWTDGDWKGVGRADLVFYELHVGTFTREGTFEAMVPRLRELRELGVTAIEIMPVAQFPGDRNWGYDGVLPYAAQNTYGGPHGLAKLVDACHAAGLAVFLDVVYNHFGPEGNYLDEFGHYFTDKYKTPWGRAINYDDPGCEPVRDYILDNVRMWLEEFHFDGLRLDAVHAIYDLGARPILRAIREVADEVAGRTGRTIHIVAESDQNDPRIVSPPSRGGHGIDAQWSDDFHHAVHSFLTGETRGYYQDYGSPKLLARSLRTPFVYAGEYSPHRKRKHGAPPEGIPGDQFVVCVQNHDQVGNRAKGDRLTSILGAPARQRLAATLLLLSPHLPLLFMGEEYGETNPFPFFCSFCGEELVQAVREGRKREFADFMGPGEEVPLPDACDTFESARLSWSWPEGTAHAGLRRLYGDLLAARKQWPAMRNFSRRSARLFPDESHGPLLELIRGGDEHDPAKTARALFNLSDRPQQIPGDERPRGETLLFTSEARRYGGARRAAPAAGELAPFECVVYGPAEWVRYGDGM
jgi:maltooligosyltrehalose trehalohydrolase